MKEKCFHNALPAPALRDYIQHYTFVDVPFAMTRRLEFRAMPSCNTRIVLFLGEPSLQKAGGRLEPAGAYTLNGFYSRPHLFIPTQSLQQVMIHFTPWGVQPFLDFPLSDITDTRAELQYIFRDGLEELVETLRREGPQGRWKNKLDEFLIEQLKPPISIARRARQVIRHIADKHGAARLSALAKEFCLGERTLQRLVHNSTGVNFKFFSMLARMEYARRLLDREAGLRLADIALRAGYYDQAHFNHEFQAAYGEPPGAYRKKKHKEVWKRLER